MSDRPWFLWDVQITDAEFRERLTHADPRIRAQWQGTLLREARYKEVWQYVRLQDVLSNLENVRLHLGRRRDMWEWLIDGWRRDGLLPS